MRFLITHIQFDCSLDDDDWFDSDRIYTEERLAEVYSGQIREAVGVSEIADSISDESGWCVSSLSTVQLPN